MSLTRQQLVWIACDEDCADVGVDLVLLEAILPSIRVYTTRVDTVYGMTYAVLAPDHPSV